MRKGILKAVLCGALSLVMATGGIFVSAAPKQGELTTKIQSVQNVKFIKAQKNVISRAQARTTVRLNDVTVPTIWNTTVKPAVKSITLSNESYMGTVVIKNSGTLVAGFGTEFLVRDAKNNYVMGSTNGILYSANMKPGKYYLYTKKAVMGTGKISLSLYPNQNNRTLGSKTIMIGGTGKNSYQYFKVKKRGIAIIGLQGIWVSPSYFGEAYGISSYVQKKSGSSWKTVSSSQYTTKDRNYNVVYGLPAGSYRIVLQSTYKSGVIVAAYKQVAAKDSYGTSKKKAKTIGRKKSKKQTFLTTDSAKKEHWYKIKVSKKRTTHIDVTNLGSSGKIYCSVSGRVKFKTKKIKYGQRYYIKNAPKGTYYIRLKRYTKSVTGAYKVKYAK